MNETSPTKLHMFSSQFNKTIAIREALSRTIQFNQTLGYQFTFETPSVEVVISKPQTEKYINWRGKERERTVWPSFPYTFHLQFTKVLTDEELKFWRIWKLGYVAREFNN